MNAQAEKPQSESHHAGPLPGDSPRPKSTAPERDAAGRVVGLSFTSAKTAGMIAVDESENALRAYVPQGLTTVTPMGRKSAVLRVTTAIPCTRAVAAMSASRPLRRSGT